MAKNPIKPTNENLCRIGAEPLTRWLIAAAKDRRTITYGEAKRRLEQEYGFSTIFPVMMGRPAGEAMDLILEADKTAPLLNVLLVQQGDGMPGKGAGWYMGNRFHDDWLKGDNARKHNREKWRKYFERAAKEAYNYPNWEKLYERVYEKKYKPDTILESQKPEIKNLEKDGLPRGRSGEGKNHKALRLWVKDNSRKLLPNLKLVRSKTEVDLLSGDRVDVVYYAADKTVAIEVKSRDSNDLDFQRGVYQCVKYRAVLEVMDARSTARIESILVTETPLPGDLQELARRLKIKHIEVPKRR